VFVRVSDLKSTSKIKTGILTLDEQCGGLSRSSFTVLSGEFGAGKTALGYQILAHVLMEGEVAIIDTEGTFNLRRFAEIAKAQLEAEGVQFEDALLDKVHYALTPTLEELIGFKGFEGKKPVFEGRGVFEELKKRKFAAILIDSLGVIREEFPGRELLYARTKVMSRLVREFARLRAKGTTIIATNHIYEGIEGKEIYGGSYIKHFATYHILIEKKGGIKRKVVTLDFPECPKMEITTYLCRAGLVDALEAEEEEVEECCGPFVKKVMHPRVCKKAKD